MTTSTTSINSDEPLNLLPTEAAWELRNYAETRCSRIAREKKRARLRPRLDETDANVRQHFNSFKKKCEGFLSEPTCKDIKAMLKCAGRYSAKARKGELCLMPWNRQNYTSEAEIDKQNMEMYCRSVIDKREISVTLANNIKKMALAAAWFAAYSIFGPEEERDRQNDQLNTDFKRIHGDVKVVNMKFIMDEARITSQRPITISEKEINNDSDVEQTATFSFSVIEGKTSSTTHTVNFSYGIGATFSAGFPSVGEINCQFSFNFSHDHSFQECINTAITRSYEFPLVVPAHNNYVARATVHEAKMEIPYQLQFDFGGARRSVRGLWKGVACSRATYDIERIPDNDNGEPEPYPCNIF